MWAEMCTSICMICARFGSDFETKSDWFLIQIWLKSIRFLQDLDNSEDGKIWKREKIKLKENSCLKTICRGIWFSKENALFFNYIHFELARLAAGTTVDTVHAPIDDFRRFWSIFSIRSVSKATPGTIKWTRFYAFSQVGRRRVLLTIARPGFVFFVIIFWWIFNDFEWFVYPWREQSNTGNDKNTTVLCIFIGRSMACVSDHCNIGIHVFRDHFAMILIAFWRHFAWFWAPVWKPDIDI